MSVQRQVSDQTLDKTHDLLRSQPSSSSSSSSSSVNPLTLQWGDLEGNFVSFQNSIEARLKDLKIKEAQVDDRLKELEAKERAIAKLKNIDSDGQKLLALLSDSVFEQEKLCESVQRALELSDEPAKLVLNAVGDFYCENVELGFVGNVRKRSCVVLLEQLARLGPRIAPAVKVEAASLARQWRAKIRVEGQKGVLEMMGFLLLLAAYDLVDEFDSGEMLGVLQSVRQRNERIEDWDMGEECGLADNDPPLVSTCLESQEKTTEQSLEEDLELVNQIASAFNNPFDALKCFCVGMDGKNLKLFLYQYVEEHDSWSSEVRDALSHAPDPAKLVLDAMPGFLRQQAEFHKSLSIKKVRKSCILLLEQLMSMSPQISPDVREKALELADEWGSNLGQIYQPPITVYGFLLFVAAYGFESKYEAEELLRLLGIASQYKTTFGLCRALGLADKAQDIIQSLIQKTMLLEAVDNVFAYNLVDKFQPVRLLKGYLTYSKKRISKKGNNLGIQQAVDKEIAAIRTVITYVVKYKLELKYPLKELEKQILKLEKQKVQTNDTAQVKKPKAQQKTNVTNPAVSLSSGAILDSQVRVELSPDGDRQWDTRASMLSTTSPWPQLEAFCISSDCRSLSLFSQEHVEKQDSLASSSYSPEPELRSVCVDKDGKVLRQFLYDHLKDHDSMSSEVSYTLQCTSDPAKLVLDAMPGCLYSQSQPEDDKSVSVNTLRKRWFLLLEQLLSISPQISLAVEEDAMRVIHQWMAFLRKKGKTPLNAYGFLHFLAAYGLVLCYEEEELLGLLMIANKYKVSPGLCRILGLADKAKVHIINLMKKTQLLEAIDHIYAFELVDMFPPPARLLKDHIESSKKILKNGTKLPSKKAIRKEIAAARNVIKCITKYRLESQYPPRDVEKHIAELERLIARIKETKKIISAQTAQA